MLSKIAFLHTSSVHVSTFDGLVAELLPQVEAVHVVNDALLAEARLYGLTAAVRGDIHRAVQQLAQQGATQIICTCSTIGDAAEQTPLPAEVSVMRVDRPLAERAVTSGQRIAVLATLASTLETTRLLLTETAASLKQDVTISMVHCTEAWPYFERGDLLGYHQAIAAVIKERAAEADVMVLAQASMAPAAELCGELAVPILSSPRLAVLAVVGGR